MIIIIIVIIIIIIIIKGFIPILAVANALALIGWFERVVMLCGGTKAKKQQPHRSNSGSWTGMLVTLIGRLYGTDPYSFMKEHVISIEEVSC